METLRHTLLAIAIALVLPLAAHAGPVNVNTADAETISAELKGIGLARAKAIIEYRQANGPFKSYEDLLEVKGVGARTIELNRKNILFEDQPAAAGK